MDTGGFDFRDAVPEVHRDPTLLESSLCILLKLGFERRKELGCELVNVNLCCVER
jgi:hypothetical protein